MKANTDAASPVPHNTLPAKAGGPITSGQPTVGSRSIKPTGTVGRSVTSAPSRRALSVASCAFADCSIEARASAHADAVRQ